ncbi:hypothetical protein C943_03642 [Mariniradius saccharolyticus AK6]|uniref:Uncharacterized protein n=1 Tax=Mariniradius saccharolyticus AK6 TaxID=1239962 RepID=M7XIR4_9BACT|nr:hypothetical protein C943_03642 [Mariniradius saccharolyticus AK6]
MDRKHQGPILSYFAPISEKWGIWGVVRKIWKRSGMQKIKSPFDDFK